MNATVTGSYNQLCILYVYRCHDGPVAKSAFLPPQWVGQVQSIERLHVSQPAWCGLNPAWQKILDNF